MSVVQVVSMRETKQREDVSIEILNSVMTNTLTPEYLATRLLCRPNLETKDQDGFNALMVTAIQGNTTCLKMLIQANANVDAIKNDGQTALHCAARKGHADCVYALLCAGANRSIRTKSGATPLFCAALECKANCMNVLLQYGADLWGEENRVGLTPMAIGLFRTFDNPDSNHTEDLKNDMLRVFLEHYASEDGVTALMCAASYGRPSIVAKLLECKADIHAEDKYGTTALVMALMSAGDQRDRHPRSQKPACVELLRGHRTNDQLNALKMAVTKQA